MQAAHKLRQWRSRRRDEKLHAVMHSLLPRIKASEEYLRDFIIQIVEKKLALRDQARYLKCRLDSCINYNGDSIDGQEDLIEEMRNAVNRLSTESTIVKGMVSFNVELVRQRVMETVRHNRTFVSWGSKAVLLRPISEQELAEDADHPLLMGRLNHIREVRGVSVYISNDLSDNLSICICLCTFLVPRAISPTAVPTPRGKRDTHWQSRGLLQCPQISHWAATDGRCAWHLYPWWPTLRSCAMPWLLLCPIHLQRLCHTSTIPYEANSRVLSAAIAIGGAARESSRLGRVFKYWWYGGFDTLITPSPSPFPV